MADKHFDINTLHMTTFETSLHVGDIIIHRGDRCLVVSLEPDGFNVFRGTEEEVDIKKWELGL